MVVDIFFLRIVHPNERLDRFYDAGPAPRRVWTSFPRLIRGVFDNAPRGQLKRIGLPRSNAGHHRKRPITRSPAAVVDVTLAFVV